MLIYIKGGASRDRVWKQGADENVWTWDEGRSRRLEKIAYEIKINLSWSDGRAV